MENQAKPPVKATRSRARKAKSGLEQPLGQLMNQPVEQLVGLAAGESTSQTADQPGEAASPRRGRPPGRSNKATTLLKDAILAAAEAAGDGDIVKYLTIQALEMPSAFMTLLGKVLPLQITGDPDAPMVQEIEIKIVDPVLSARSPDAGFGKRDA